MIVTPADRVTKTLISTWRNDFRATLTPAQVVQLDALNRLILTGSYLACNTCGEPSPHQATCARHIPPPTFREALV